MPGGHTVAVTTPVDAFDAIVLAGGRARRLNGRDKPAETVGGRRLLDVALGAVADARRVVVVGPPRDVPDGVVTTREDPPGSGPVAALAAGLEMLAGTDAGAVVVLAADLPFLTPRAVADLAARRTADAAPAAFAVDSGGRLQYLIGVWDRATLAAAIAEAPGPAMRDLVPPGAIGVVVADTTDVDTPADLENARSRARRSPDGARAAIAETVTALQAGRLPAVRAIGGALAEPLLAAADFPAADISAMDGYAVAGPGPWRVRPGAVLAGGTPGDPLTASEAVRIATGARVPDGGHRIIRDEEVERDGDLLRETSTGRDDTRRAGSEWHRGAELAAAGTLVDDALSSLAGSARVDALTVRGPVRARLVTTGDEIGPGGIPDTASGPVAAALRGLGCSVGATRHARDTPSAFDAALAGAADLVVVIGATGRGAADQLRGALDRAGATYATEGIDVRPGGSALVAVLPDRRVVLGLGGNPLAAVAGVALLGRPVVAALIGAAPTPPELIRVADASALARPDGWRIVPVAPGADGRWIAPRAVPTGHLAAVVGRRSLALLPPGARDDELVERLR